MATPGVLQTYQQGTNRILSTEEKREAAQFARACVELEGFTLPDASKKLTDQFIRGDFDLPVFIEKSLELAHKIKEGSDKEKLESHLTYTRILELQIKPVGQERR